eukprot:symbB.v1.2.007326.t1/scaffold420.1/size231607/2
MCLSQGFDHHCRYLNVCVGGRTYPAWYFFVLLLLTLVVICAFGNVHALMEPLRHHLHDYHPVAFFLIIGSAAVVTHLEGVFLFALLAQHSYFCLAGITTLEYIKDQAPPFPSLPPRGWREAWGLVADICDDKKERDRLTVVAIDGHEKIATKCAGEPPSKGGRPRKDSQISHSNNGWFMVTSPDTGLTLLIVEMRNREDNAIALFCLEKIVELYPAVNAVIYDRACSCMSAGQKMSSLRGIKYWAVDRFHATRCQLSMSPC